MLAYYGYRENAGRKSLVTGAELPRWEDLPPEIQRAWIAAAAAVLSGEITGTDA
jgi:hypothetical protein